ncbi:FHA domain-containing protein [Streptomyces niveiscabiei]|uniref:FHA domain-containing protein n=1 Tax=Streptomyces niveiscabiei TaxID=164115 RepID=A0ABW9HVH0_9ACTN
MHSNSAHSVIVVPRHRHPAQIRLAPGEKLAFGRVPTSGHGRGLPLRHEGIQLTAGLITAYRAYWTLTNLSPCQTYLVENPEGAGEHIKVGPGRREAPIPFEFGRVVLPAGQELIDFDVWATCHDYQGAQGPREGQEQAPALPAFPLDRTRRYFLVLASLCEPRLREAPFAQLPSTREIIERLRPAWPAVSKSAVQWSVDYLAEKFCLTPARHSGKRESLVSLALRFDLVREDDLTLLNRRRQAS